MRRCIMADENSKTILVTDDNISDISQKYPLMVVDCWAPWCGPCKMIAPIVEELAVEYEGKVAFGKLNVDENDKLARLHNIMSIPTLLLLKDGDVVERIVGAVPKEHIVHMMKHAYQL
jgi:thioredoxin 1